MAASDLPDHVLEAQLRATRGLLRAERVEDCVDILVALVRELGGDIGDPDAASTAATPIDVSFGMGRPRVVTAPPRSEERRVLERVLAETLEDARLAVQRIRQGSRVRDDATRDPLTGLMNRRAFGRLLGRLEESDCVVILDLDRFKEVNDRHGHAAGDGLLRDFADALRDSLRQADHAARLGGDEFALVLRGMSDEEAGAVIERLLGRWKEVRPLDVAFSAGVAAVRGGGTAALEEADQALYRSKGGGRDRITIASQLAREASDGP